MERWNCAKSRAEEIPKVDEFIEAVLAVCGQYNLSIGHEDEYGAFVVHSGYDEIYASWLRHAHYYTPPAMKHAEALKPSHKKQSTPNYACVCGYWMSAIEYRKGRCPSCGKVIA